MAGDYLDQLADFVANVGLDDLQRSTVAAAKDVVAGHHRSYFGR